MPQHGPTFQFVWRVGERWNHFTQMSSWCNMPRQSILWSTPHAFCRSAPAEIGLRGSHCDNRVCVRVVVTNVYIYIYVYTHIRCGFCITHAIEFDQWKEIHKSVEHIIMHIRIFEYEAYLHIHMYVICTYMKISCIFYQNDGEFFFTTPGFLWYSRVTRNVRWSDVSLVASVTRLTRHQL